MESYPNQTPRDFKAESEWFHSYTHKVWPPYEYLLFPFSFPRKVGLLYPLWGLVFCLSSKTSEKLWKSAGTVNRNFRLFVHDSVWL